MSGRANRRNPSVYGTEKAQSSDSRRNSHNGAHLLADWSERINRTVWIGRFLQVLQSCEERRSGRDRLLYFHQRGRGDCYWQHLRATIVKVQDARAAEAMQGAELEIQAT
jgi:hypothetical protein